MSSDKLAANSFINFIRAKGLKLTPERLVVLETITGFKGHFDADELCAAIKKQGEKISRATVYRCLPLFTQSGIIRETIRSGEKSTYESSIGIAHHDHLLCIKCGRVIEFADNEIEKLQNELCSRYEFEPVDHHMSIRGYCKSCHKD